MHNSLLKQSSTTLIWYLSSYFIDCSPHLQRRIKIASSVYPEFLIPHSVHCATVFKVMSMWWINSISKQLSIFQNFAHSTFNQILVIISIIPFFPLLFLFKMTAASKLSPFKFIHFWCLCLDFCQKLKVSIYQRPLPSVSEQQEEKNAHQ